MSDGSVPPTAVGRRTRFRDVLAVREFRALYVVSTFGIIGDEFARIAVAWIVFEHTGSAFLTGLSFSVTYLPWILGGPVLSVYADRHPRRTVMITCEIARAVLVLLIALVHAPAVVLITLVAIMSAFDPPFKSARASMIPDVVGEGTAYSVAANLGNTTSQVAGVVGFAAAGGLVAAIGARPTLLIDAATFALSALVAICYVKRRPAAIVERSRWVEEMRVGATVVFSNPRLRWLVVTSWLVMGSIITTEAAAVPYANFHGGGALEAGILAASLPLGVVLGALASSLVSRDATGERLMMPMAVATPTVLAFTAFNPPPALAAFVWLLAGVCSSMTLIANRILVATVPREVRGRAFGVAAAGISGALGIGTLLTGILSSHVGPAKAIADIALPALALIVVFSVTSANFSPSPVPPMEEQSLSEDEEAPVPAPSRRPEPQVWALNAAMTAVALALAPLLLHAHAYDDINLPVAWLTFLFVIGFLYPLIFKYGQQSWTVLLETVPMVLGLLFIGPLSLLVVRVAAVAFTHVARRPHPPIIRSSFNIASQACCTLASITVFRLVAPTNRGVHPGVWPAVFAAVLIGEVLSAALVTIVIWLNDRAWQLRSGLRAAAIAAGVSVVMTFLAIALAASLSYDMATAWAITIFVALSIGGLRTYHRLADRADALDSLVKVARELSPSASNASDLAPALSRLRKIIKADSLEVIVPLESGGDYETVIRVYDDSNSHNVTEVLERPSTEGPFSAPPSKYNAGWTWRRAAARLRPFENHQLSTQLRSSGRVLGILTASNQSAESRTFDRGDVRLLDAAADQLAAALEKGRLVESLRKAATLDTLTGLANLESLRTFLDTTLEGSTGGILILLNLDRFHEVNDMLGHDAGDVVLAEVARRLESSPGDGALAARVGGDQFALAIPGPAGPEVARLAAMAVKSRVDGSIRFAKVSADVRATVGIARAPDHGNDAVTLLRRAEMAMTAAKGGSSGIGEWAPAYERDGSRRLQLISGLRVALGDGSLRVEYQPKLVLATGEVTGFEALVRWSHPELGPVSPAEFVPMAEATGLISALTSIVLRQALTTCRSWHDAGKPVGVAVNVSARSLDDNVLVGQVAAMLTASGLEPRWLTLEITESSVMEDHERSVEVLRELRMLGVRLSIDDFGTGYSSLHQLRGLPVHEVKIDRSFIETVDSDQADRAVVRAVVELCDSLGLVTVAEGVEKATQAYTLESLGVAQVQGYFHGRPMTEVAAMEWLLPRHAISYAAH